MNVARGQQVFAATDTFNNRGATLVESFVYSFLVQDLDISPRESMFLVLILMVMMMILL